jgi:hypothetical protein
VPKDTTKYIFNGEEYGTGRLALAIIQYYIEKHSPSLSALHQVFPDHLQGGNDIIITHENFTKELAESDDVREYFFSKEGESLKTSDNFTIYVSSQWGGLTIGSMLKKAKELKYDVEKLKDEQKSIEELYEEYKLAPSSDWIQTYKKLCDKLAGYKGKPVSEYDQDLLIEVWRTPDNGVAGVRPGFISFDEFSALLPDLP